MSTMIPEEYVGEITNLTDVIKELETSRQLFVYGSVPRELRRIYILAFNLAIYTKQLQDKVTRLESDVAKLKPKKDNPGQNPRSRKGVGQEIRSQLQAIQKAASTRNRHR